jgi:hypothetical protein
LRGRHWRFGFLYRNNIESEIGKGTTFTLDLPRISSKDLNVQTIDPSKKGAA